MMKVMMKVMINVSKHGDVWCMAQTWFSGEEGSKVKETGRAGPGLFRSLSLSAPLSLDSSSRSISSCDRPH